MRTLLVPILLGSAVSVTAVPLVAESKDPVKEEKKVKDPKGAHARELVRAVQEEEKNEGTHVDKLIADIREAWPKLKVDKRTQDIIEQPETDAFEVQCKAIGAPALRRLIDESIENQEYTGMYDFWNKVVRKMTAADPSLDPVLLGLLGRPERDEGDPAPYRIREALRSAGPRVIPALTKIVEGTYWAEQEWKLSPVLEGAFQEYVAKLSQEQRETKSKAMRGQLNEVPWAMGLSSLKDPHALAIESARVARNERKVGKPRGETATEVAQFLLEQPTAAQTDEAVETFLRSLTYNWKSREFSQALLAIERVGGEKAVEALRMLTLRKDLPFDVRMPCGEALVRVDTKGKTQEDLLHLLSSTDLWERRIAIGAFLIQVQKVQENFLYAPFSEKTERGEGEEAFLYKVLAPKLLMALAKAKGDAEPDIREKAASAFGILLSAERTHWEHTKGAFVRNPEILSALRAILRDDPLLTVRRTATDALILHPSGDPFESEPNIDPFVIDSLFSCAIDSKEDPGIRATALEYLAHKNSLFLLAKEGKFDAFRSTCTAILSGQKGKRASYLEQRAAAALGSALRFSYDPVAGWSAVYGELSVAQKKDFLEKREKILQEYITFYRTPLRDALVQNLSLTNAEIMELLRSCPGRDEESATKLTSMLGKVWEGNENEEEERGLVRVLSGLLAEKGKEQKGISRESRPAVREAATALAVELCEERLSLLLLPLTEESMAAHRTILTAHLQMMPLSMRREVIRELHLDEGVEVVEEEGIRRISATEDGVVRTKY